MEKEEIRQIYLPELPESSFITSYAQLRPKRNGGCLIKEEKVQAKIVIHNYGHGGAGVSMAPGSAIEAVQIAEKHLKGVKSVGVIGSGVIGLFTCHMLLKRYRQMKIRVYAKNFPIFGVKDNNQMITSQVAPGMWFHFNYGRQINPKNKIIASTSFKEYQAMMTQQQFKHVIKEVDIYDLTDEKEMQEEFVLNMIPEIQPTYKEIKLLLNGKTPVWCRTLKSVKIDMQPFLKIMMEQLKTSGVQFITANIDQKALLQLNHQVIFNCTGLGSRNLFKDNELKGVKGHLVEYRNPNPQKYNYILQTNFGKQIVDYYMHDSRILLGFTEEEEENCTVDPKQIQMLQKSHLGILRKFGLLPDRAKL